MEQVGSTADVNVVVECARFHGKQQVRPNPEYLVNPYAEFSGTFYWGLDNAPGTRRYYVLKDDDKTRVRSVMLGNIGETDADAPSRSRISACGPRRTSPPSTTPSSSGTMAPAGAGSATTKTRTMV